VAQEIDAFWQSTRERLAREPMEATVEPVAEPLPYKKFKITLRSFGGVHIHAWLALPIQGEAPAKPWPVIVTVYERLPGAKTLKFYPDLPHTSCVDFYNLSWTWLEQHFRQRSP
jgi:cephalosporin-C deacetylase-like acetyl esterase